MKRMARMVIVLSTIMLAFVAIKTMAAQTTLQPLNRVVAIVNGQPVTEHQFDVFLNRALTRLKASGQVMPNAQKFRQYLLNQYIDRVLQLQIASRANINITDKQVDQQIASLAANQKMTPAQFTQAVVAQGYSEAEFRQEVKTEMIIGLLQRQVVGSHITVSQQDIKAQLLRLKKSPQVAGQYHVIDFLTPLKPGATSSQIAASVKSLQGTDLGWRPLAALPDMFATIVPTLKVNELSGLIRAPNGFHVIRIVGIKNSTAAALPPTAVAAQQVYMMKAQKALQAWEATLRKQAIIQLYP